LNIAL